MTKISVEAAGGRALRTYRLEDQTNRTTQMSDGMIVQVSSSDHRRVRFGARFRPATSGDTSA